MITPPSLKKGDIVDIISPANYVKEEELHAAISIIENMGLNVRISQYCLERYKRYAGTLEQRVDDFRSVLRNNDSKAILCSSGGYGSVQLLEYIVDDIAQNPKWLIGFSDISSIHALYQSKGIKSVHASMCRDMIIPPLDKPSNGYLQKILFGDEIQYEFASHKDNIQGCVTGRLVGGNLSVLSELMATPYNVFNKGDILFIEDVNEKLYKIERIFYHLKYAGVLESVKGLIVGRFENCNSQGRFQDIMELVLRFFPDRHIPICFDAPMGHISDNYPLILGGNVSLQVGISVTNLKFE